MPDLKVRLVKKDENNNEHTVAEGTYDKVTVLQKGQLASNSIINKEIVRLIFIEDNGKVEGEIYVKGPAIFKYYFNKEEATRKAFDSQGYYMMGKCLVLRL